MKAKAHEVLTTLEDCERVMGQLRLATMSRQLNLTGKEADLAQIEESYGPKLAALDEQIADYTGRLQDYYMTHLTEVEADGKKSVQLRHGIMGRRLKPPALKLIGRAWNWATVAAAVGERLGKRYLRWQAPEVDKEALKNAGIEPDRLRECGLKIDQEEVFFAEPATEE